MNSLLCRLCGSQSLSRLPDPHPNRAIVSNLAVIAEALEKYACTACGIISRVHGPVNFQSTEYDLYAHAPGGTIENARQASYARWISSLAPGARSFFEAGCGNGSLLLALRTLNPHSTVCGVEPAPGAAAQALTAGVDVECDLLRPRARGKEASLAIAVNVIEHTPDPLGFVRDLATQGEQVLVVCPDGSVPNSEMLFADHLQSLTSADIQRLFTDAGLRVVSQERAPAEIGPFLATLAKRDRNDHASVDTPPRSHDAARRYLETWSGLDAALQQRLDRFDDLLCFGAGEAAALLRAYCPKAWARIRACIADEVSDHTFFEKEVYRTADVRLGPVLLGARPQVQHALASRISAAGGTPITWDDLVSF
ncbi:MAG: class I SAM-dependent methyltransferase [Candidatus Eremiobacteraeota bacterium]|nr:class I SAM-dependent methyltransferase [Candidatus Eremiobacteraeota bacterium]